MIKNKQSFMALSFINITDIRYKLHIIKPEIDSFIFLEIIIKMPKKVIIISKSLISKLIMLIKFIIIIIPFIK